MARTVFSIAKDEDGAYPVYNTSIESAKNRYVGFDGPISFVGDTEYIVPKIQFTIIAEDGGRMKEAPIITLRAPPSLNLTNTNSYVQDGPIFGGGVSQGEGAQAFTNLFESTKADFLKNAGNAAGQFAYSAKDALEYSLKKAGGNLAGFIGSAGLGNISQFEFLAKRTVNPMQQQLFKGPAFRRYQLPFNLKPRNSVDARNINAAVNALRIAASAGLPAEGKDDEGFVGEGSNFTFGYPHLLQFDLIVGQTIGGFGGASSGEVKFQSKVCVIEAVSTDYGGQKMTFMKDGYPSETNLSLSLIEVTPRTYGDANIDRERGRKLV